GGPLFRRLYEALSGLQIRHRVAHTNLHRVADLVVRRLLPVQLQGHEVPASVLVNDHAAQQGLDPGERVAVALAAVARLAGGNEYLQVVDAVHAERVEVLDLVRVLGVAERALPLATLPAEPEFEILLGVVDAEGVALASSSTCHLGSMCLGQLGSLRRFGVAPATPRHQAVRTRPGYAELIRAERLVTLRAPLLR